MRRHHARESCKRDMAQEASGAQWPWELGGSRKARSRERVEASPLGICLRNPCSLIATGPSRGCGNDTTSGYHSRDQNPCDDRRSLQGAVDGLVGAGDTLRVTRCLHPSKCWLLDYPGSTTGKKKNW